jgi:hypothetical protein|tara:strand:- start:114438 stop:114668 length:231 start_codon:yes stop_codon:yes gene_type:complete
MLLQLRDYLAKEQYVSLEQLSRVFKIDKTALVPMLDVWVSRGVLHVDGVGEEKAVCATACGGCGGDAPKYYRYVAV